MQGRYEGTTANKHAVATELINWVEETMRGRFLTPRETPGTWDLATRPQKLKKAKALLRDARLRARARALDDIPVAAEEEDTEGILQNNDMWPIHPQPLMDDDLDLFRRDFEVRLMDD
jgi:hypothetical protein